MEEIGSKVLPGLRGKKRETARTRANAKRDEQRLLQGLREVVQGRSSLTSLKESLNGSYNANKSTNNQNDLVVSTRPIKTASDLRSVWSSRPVEEVREVLAVVIDHIEVDDGAARVIFAHS